MDGVAVGLIGPGALIDLYWYAISRATDRWRRATFEKLPASGAQRSVGIVARNILGVFTISGFAMVLASCGGMRPKDEASSHKRLDLAKDFLRKHELEAAESESNKALALHAGNEEAYNLRGLVHMVRAVDTQRSMEIDTCLTGIDAEVMQRDLDTNLGKAERDFARAAELAPDYGEAWSNRGVVATLLEDFSSAERHLVRALENPNRLASPGLTRAHLGWALFHQNRLPEAAKELRQAMQFQPNMCVATYRLARVYFAREEWEKAAELFQTVSDDPSCGSQEASLYLMKTRMQQGLVDDARRARDACLKISAQSCIASRCRADGGALGEQRDRQAATVQGARP